MAGTRKKSSKPDRDEAQKASKIREMQFSTAAAAPIKAPPPGTIPHQGVVGPQAGELDPNSNLNYDRISYILVVDDDNTLLKFFKIHLNKFFSRVIVVKNAKEAINTLREREIDLVVTDIRMPRMDGFQLMRRIRKHDASIPVLVVSGALLTAEQKQQAHKTADGYLKKPFSVDELHNFLDKGLHTRELYKRLADLLPDRRLFRDLLRGKTKLEKHISDQERLSEARGLLSDIKQAG